jgi:hypothetical protein
MDENLEKKTGTELKTISINVTKDMYDWLRRNPGINRSEVFREAIYELQGRVTFQLEYQVFIIKVVIVISTAFLLFLLLPAVLLFILPIIYVCLFIYLMLDALFLLGRYRERLENARIKKRIVTYKH